MGTCSLMYRALFLEAAPLGGGWNKTTVEHERPRREADQSQDHQAPFGYSRNRGSLAGAIGIADAGRTVGDFRSVALFTRIHEVIATEAKYGRVHSRISDVGVAGEIGTLHVARHRQPNLRMIVRTKELRANPAADSLRTRTAQRRRQILIVVSEAINKCVGVIVEVDFVGTTQVVPVVPDDINSNREVPDCPEVRVRSFAQND